MFHCARREKNRLRTWAYRVGHSPLIMKIRMKMNMNMNMNIRMSMNISNGQRSTVNPVCPIGQPVSGTEEKL